MTFEVIKKTFQIELFCCYCFFEEAGRSVIYLNWSIRFSHPNFYTRNFFNSKEKLFWGVVFFCSEWKRVVSFWVVIILKFHLNGFFGECDIWAIFQSQNHYSSKALLWGCYYFKILYFDSWYVILVQSLIGDRGISEMIDELWEHDDCLENQFSLFSCSWKEKCQSFFSLISFSKISKMKVLKYTIVLFIHLKIWSRNWIYFL